MTQIRIPAAVMALIVATFPAAAIAQQMSPATYPVGNPLGLPIVPVPDRAFAAISSNVKVYGSVFSAESCAYDPGRGVIVIPNRGVPQDVRANDAWITLMNRDGSIHTARWLGVQGRTQRDSLTPPLVLNEPLGSEVAGGLLYLADRDGGTGANDPSVAVIRRFDMRTGVPLAAIRVSGAAWFNDIAVASDGTVYATMTPDGRVWRVPMEGNASIVVEGAPLARPNGIAIDRQGNLVVVNVAYDAVLTFSRDGVLLRTERAAQAGSDGIVIMEDGTKYVSSVVNGGVSRIRPGQPAELIASNIPNAASMCYDPQARQLVIPMNANNAMAFVSLAPPPPAAAPTPAPAPLPAGQTNDPFPAPIPATDGAITVSVREFASLPDIEGGAARAMTLVEEPGGRRLWVSDMRGVLYVMSTDGGGVTPYLDLRDPKWRLAVQSQGRERGLQSFALHPQFAQRGTPGYGKFYTYADVADQAPLADFTTPNANSTHDTVLLEWTARSATAATYDGGAPRELIRLRQPFANHNGGALAFNPLARARSADFGLLYIGIGDGGSGGDPMNLAQNLGSAFGKIFRIDPLGKDGPDGKYGVPASNPFVTTSGARPEIFAYGMRNSQRVAWDTKSGKMYLSDIGQNTVEEVNPLSAGANLGWNVWEGSYRFMGRQGVSTEAPRSDPRMTYPVVEWDQIDPVLLDNGSSASVGLVIYRSKLVPQLTNRMVFSDMPSGEVFHVSADKLPNGGQAAIRRVLFTTGTGTVPRSMVEIIQEKNVAQGKPAATRADLRFDMTAAGRIFMLNKADGTIRVVER